MTSTVKLESIPVVRLGLAAPFLAAASGIEGSLNGALLKWGLTAADFADPDRFVPAMTMYEIVETLGDIADASHAGVRLGAQLDPFGWRPLKQAVSQSASVAELLLRFSIDAYREATSVTFALETKGERTCFSEERKILPGVSPRHNDGFGAAYTLTILRKAVGRNWQGRDVIVEVSDPSIFPARYLGIRLARSGPSGFKVTFPTAWMLLKPRIKPTGQRKPTPSTVPAPSSHLDSLRVILSTYLADATLNTQRIASLCGVSSRTLARQLANQGTTVKGELDNLRSATAKSLLQNNTMTIADVGKRVGYPDPSVFSRTFKRWTGELPRDFRRRTT